MSILSLQAGAASLDGSRDPNLGILAIRLKCRADDIVTAVTAAPPDIGILGLRENQPRTFGRNESGEQGGYNVEITLEGHIAPETAEGEEYSMEGSLGEDEIDTHPLISVLRKLYNADKKLQQTDPSTWPETLAEDDNTGAGSKVQLPTTGLGDDDDYASEGGSRNPMHGVTSYYVPSLIWTRKWVTAQLPPGLADTLGTIDNPPGHPPELGNGRQWIKVRARATWRGNVWQVEESWMTTGPYRIAPELYRHH